MANKVAPVDSSPGGLLILSYAYPPAVWVGGRRIEAFCRYLPPLGWTPLVVTASSGPGRKRGLDVWHGTAVYRSGDLNPLAQWRGLRSRMGTSPPPADRPGHVSPAEVSNGRLRAVKRAILAGLTTPDDHMGWIPFAVSAGLRVARQYPVDAILVSSPPHSAQIAGLILAKALRKPLVADFRDLWTMNEYASDLWPGTRAARLNACLERMVVREADGIIANTHTAEVMLRQAYPWAASKMTTIPNGFDPVELEGILPRTFPKFTLTHAGSFYRDRNPRCFLEGLARWLDRSGVEDLRSKVNVLFIGRHDPSVSHLAHTIGLEGIVELAPSVPPSELYPILAGSDVLLAILGFRTTSRSVMPAKLYDYLAVGRPILALVPEGEVTSLLASHPLHRIVTCDDPSAVATALESLYAQRDLVRPGSGKAGLGVHAWPQFWRPHLARSLHEVLAGIIGSPGPVSPRLENRPPTTAREMGATYQRN